MTTPRSEYRKDRVRPPTWRPSLQTTLAVLTNAGLAIALGVLLALGAWRSW